MGATSFALRADRRGASLVEYLIVVGCIAVLAMGGWATFGRRVDEKIRGQAECIVSMSGCEGDPQGAEPGAPPAAPPEESAPLSYEDQLAEHLQTLADSFSFIAGDDGIIDDDDLRDALESSNPEVREAAQWFLDNDSARYALDVGQGDGDVDGDISREDISGLQEATQDGSLIELLADTANGEGERDGEISRDDLEALADDEGLPPAVREWATTTAEQIPEEEGCDGWHDFGCHAGNLGEWAYDTTGLDSLVDESGLDSAFEWVDESIYQNLPAPLRTGVDFFYGFQILGPTRVVTGLVDGVGGVLGLGDAYVNNLIDDPGGTIQATAEFATDPGAQAEYAWNLGSAIVSDYAERCPSSAAEAGACSFEVALEVVLAVTTGGAGNAASHADDVKYLRYADNVDDATDAAVVNNHTDDIAELALGFDTQAMNPRYAGENLPGNTVWNGRQVTYLDDAARAERQIVVRDGLLYDADGNLFDTTAAATAHSGNGRAIFIMDEQGNIYASTYQSVGEFHHSSLAGGQPVTGAGELVVENGRLTVISNRSGHYQPSAELNEQVLRNLEAQGVDVSQVRRDNWGGN